MRTAAKSCRARSSNYRSVFEAGKYQATVEVTSAHDGRQALHQFGGKITFTTPKLTQDMSYQFTVTVTDHTIKLSS